MADAFALVINHNEVDGDHMKSDDLRKKYKDYRDSIPADEREKASQLIVRNILNNWELFFGAYDKFLIYYPLGSEVDLLSLAGWILMKGKSLYFPVTEGSDINFYRVKNLNGFKKGTFGVMEPVDWSEPYSGGKAVSFTPGLVFDKKHNRLGYGKGYYDRFFTKYPEVMRIGTCFSACTADEIPTHDGDVPMIFTCTEKGILI